MFHDKFGWACAIVHRPGTPKPSHTTMTVLVIVDDATSLQKSARITLHGDL